ncbi:MAG: hypothetical protein JNK74_03795 [Candidatus Hydrogenedentes bacterium]|nr:hypothetical protein [Candidatus Hydrogenedentota bacterium]
METSNSVLEAWWSWMVHSTWQVALFAAIIWALTSVFTKTSASFRYALWFLVFLKLLIPPFLAVPWSVGTMAQHVAQAGGYITSPHDAVTPNTEVETPATLIESDTAMHARTANPPLRPVVPLKALLLGLWGVVALAMFALLIVQFIRFKRLAHLGSLEAPAWLRQMAGERVVLVGLGHTPAFRITGTLSVPAVLGVWRPVVLIPGDWLDTFDRDALGNILTHELAHIKRRDLLVGWMASCLTCCYWFHPLVWVAHLQLRREREMACDDMVLRSTRTDGKEYAGTILKGAEAADGMIPAGAGFLGLMELSGNLLQRIRSAGDAARRRRMGLRSALALTVIALGLIPMQAISDAESTATTPTDRASELALYEKAHPEVQAFIKHTCESFGRSNLWLDVGALDALTPDEREKKITYIAAVLEGEYGRQQCESLAEAGVLRDTRLLPGLKKVAAYHRDDQDYDCRAKWMAVAALGRQGDDSAIPVLIPLVDHGNQNTRMWARGSLLRLTGQTFDQDKAAWGAWWNAQGKEPRLSEDDLKPWEMPGAQASAESTVPSHGNGENELTGKGVGIELLDLKEANGEWRARLKTNSSKKWYVEGEAFEAFRLESINVEEKSVVVYEERIGKSIILRLPGSQASATSAASNQTAPEILSSNPAIGASEIDPGLSAITVTFDQDMKGGFSWTGGGELYPETTGKPHWLDKRTCELPVKLAEGRVYRVGINSKSFKNFCGENGIPARDRVLYFATKGAPPEALAGLTPPKVVSKVVGESKDKLLVTFDKPMGGGCSWTKAGGEFPETTGKVGWSEDKQTCTLPVRLEVGKTYRVGINSANAINFQSETGVPVEPEVWEFTVE